MPAVPEATDLLTFLVLSLLEVAVTVAPLTLKVIVSEAVSLEPVTYPVPWLFEAVTVNLASVVFAVVLIVVEARATVLTTPTSVSAGI